MIQGEKRTGMLKKSKKYKMQVMKQKKQIKNKQKTILRNERKSKENNLQLEFRVI